MNANDVMKLAVETNRYHQAEGNEKYFDWVRTCLTVTSGSLAILVAFQGNFVPTSPRWLWALQGAWIAFGLTIISAIVVLHYQHAACFKAAQEATTKTFIDMIQRGNLTEIGMSSIDIPWYYRTFQWLLPILFASSFIFLIIFAIVNSGSRAA